MKIIRLVAGVVTLASSLAAPVAGAADWFGFASDGQGDTYYIDRTSIRNKGRYIQVWTMANLQSPAPNGARSRKTAFLLDCESRESAVWSGISYSMPNGQGEILQSLTATLAEIKFQPAVPDSISDGVLNLSCASPK